MATPVVQPTLWTMAIDSLELYPKMIQRFVFFFAGTFVFGDDQCAFGLFIAGKEFGQPADIQMVIMLVVLVEIIQEAG